MIYYFTPYCINKNFGRAINLHCQIVPNENDWIVISDGDMCHLVHEWGKIIHNAILNHGERFDVFGCLTNRLNIKNGTHQLIGDYNEFDIRKHRELAIEQMDKEGIKEVHSVAGVFMAFKKSTWESVGGFKERSFQFDSDFCTKVRANGGKIGIINQLYVFHLYRIWAEDPGKEIKHLLPW